MIPPLVRSATLAVVLLPLAAVALRAQDSTRTAADTVVIDRPTVVVPRSALAPAPIHRNLVSIQPLAVVYEVYQAEYERALSPGMTVGLGGSAWNNSDVHYRSGDLKLRFYPSRRALQGFALGASVGYSRISENYCDYDTSNNCVRRTDEITGPSAGVLFEYNWLLGPTRDFHVGLGLGSKVIFADSKEALGSDVNLKYPTARISVGWAF